MFLFLKILFLVLFQSNFISADDSLIIRGQKPKYLKNDPFEYANKAGSSGGELRIGTIGSFDSLFPYGVKGIPPLLITPLVFSTIGETSLDEIMIKYPLIAESFEYNLKEPSLTIQIKEKLKFSNNEPITASDVLFTFEFLTKSTLVDPFYQSYWQDVLSVTKVGENKIKFLLKKESNPELPLIILELPVLPKNFYQNNESNELYSKAYGFGPYIVEDFKFGDFITYRKNHDFSWGDPKNHGRYLLEKITVIYYKDQTALLEGFKNGTFDFYVNFVAKSWAEDLSGSQVDHGWIVKNELPHQNNQGAQGFFFNLRHPIFQNIHTRQAISILFDFPWFQKVLFWNQYQRDESYFSNSIFECLTGDSKEQELELLKKLEEKYSEDVPKETFLEDVSFYFTPKTSHERKKLALKSLKKAGYILKNGKLFSKKGDPLSFSILIDNEAMGRVVNPYVAKLKEVGMEVEVVLKEDSVYQHLVLDKIFDMTPLTVPQSLSPGNEQWDMWSSSSADKPFSRNYAGLKNRAVDDLVEKITHAQTTSELILFTRTLDRLLLNLHISVLHWHNNVHRVAFWDKYTLPEKLPLYYSPFDLISLISFDPKKNEKLLHSKTLKGF